MDSQFYNFSLSPHQWKMVVNKHVYMLFEKHAILSTHPTMQMAHDRMLQQMQRANADHPLSMHPMQDTQDGHQ